MQSIVENILEGVVVANHEGRFVLWNPAARRLVGIGREEIDPATWPVRYGCFRPDRVTPYPAEELPLARALRGEVIDGEEMYLCNPARPEGAWLCLSAVPLRDEAGGPNGGVMVLRDISETRLAEERLRLVIESVLAGILLLDAGGRITMVNQPAEVIFGYGRDELNGRPFEVLAPEDQRDHPDWRLDELLHDPGPRPETETRSLRGRHKNGRPLDIQITLRLILLEGQTFILASILDVTEQKRASDLVKSVVELSPDGTVMVDHEGRIVLVNQETERIFGYGRDELLGLPVGRLVPEGARASHHEQVHGFLTERGGRPMSEGRDLMARRKDGSEFPADIALHTYQLDGRNYAIASVRDMTERRRLIDAIETSLLIQDVVGKILRTSLEPIGVEEHLSRTLDLILSVPWFSTDARAGIYLVEGGPERSA